MRRCFVCAADMLVPSERFLIYPSGRRRVFPIGCASCGVLMEERVQPIACWRHLAECLVRPVFVPDEQAPYGLDIFTLRSAATRLSRGILARDATHHEALLRPHSTHAAQAETFALEATVHPTVSLGVICRLAEREAVLASLMPHVAWTDDITLLLDAGAAPPRRVPVAGFPEGTVRIASRPLGRNFAGQRNALQDLARHSWMLQLDADESLTPETGGLLSALAALAEAGDALSVGLARRNRVDGTLSNVYPDVQYRLNRRSVRYAGRVHERPSLDGGWARSFISLHGTIEHALSRAHVLARSQRYEALDPGRGRREEAGALLSPYRE